MGKFCSNCGQKLLKKDNACSNCGMLVNGEKKKENQPNTVVVNSTVINKKTNGLAISGFIVSLISSILCCGAFSIISLILSIIGVAKSDDYDDTGKGLGIAGIIISVIGIIIFTMSLIFGGLSFSAWDAIQESINDQWENMDVSQY